MDSVVQLLLTVIVGILVVAVYAHPSSHNGAWNIPTESQRQSAGSQDSYNKDFPALPPSQKAPNVNSPYSLVNRQSGMKQDDQQGKGGSDSIPGVVVYDASNINTGGVKSGHQNEDSTLKKDAVGIPTGPPPPPPSSPSSPVSSSSSTKPSPAATRPAVCWDIYCSPFFVKTEASRVAANTRCNHSCTSFHHYKSGKCESNKCCCTNA